MIRGGARRQGTLMTCLLVHQSPSKTRLAIIPTSGTRQASFWRTNVDDVAKIDEVVGNIVNIIDDIEDVENVNDIDNIEDVDNFDDNDDVDNIDDMDDIDNIDDIQKIDDSDNQTWKQFLGLLAS